MNCSFLGKACNTLQQMMPLKAEGPAIFDSYRSVQKKCGDRVSYNNNKYTIKNLNLLAAISLKGLEVAIRSTICAVRTHTNDFYELQLINTPSRNIILTNEWYQEISFQAGINICRLIFFSRNLVQNESSEQFPFNYKSHIYGILPPVCVQSTISFSQTGEWR